MKICVGFTFFDKIARLIFYIYVADTNVNE